MRLRSLLFVPGDRPDRMEKALGLGAMLFGAPPGQRRQVFPRFYRLDQGLIERFYAARSTLPDRARILCGKPPVPLRAALRAFLPGTGRGTMRSMVEGLALIWMGFDSPSTVRLRGPVPLPVPGRI